MLLLAGQESSRIKSWINNGQVQATDDSRALGGFGLAQELVDADDEIVGEADGVRAGAVSPRSRAARTLRWLCYYRVHQVRRVVGGRGH